MKPTFYLFLFLSLFNLHSQSSNNEIISLSPNEEKVFLIPAYAQDTVLLNVSNYLTKRAKNSSFYLYEYPDKLLYKSEKVKSLTYTLVPNINGIYKLILKNENTKMVDYKVLYTVKSTRKKKPQIGYRVQKDTTYGFETEQLAEKIKLETNTVQNEKFYLNSTSNALLKGGKNRIIIPVNLPENTTEWYYVFSASREENDIKNTLTSFNLASQLTKFIKDDTSIQNAVSNLSPPPGANICDIYVINDEANAELFKEKEDYQSSLDGSRENFKSGIVKVSGASKNYLGIRNPDNLYGIHIAIEIIAIVEKTEQVKELVNIPIITSYQVPYFIE